VAVLKRTSRMERSMRLKDKRGLLRLYGHTAAALGGFDLACRRVVALKSLRTVKKARVEAKAEGLQCQKQIRRRRTLERRQLMMRTTMWIMTQVGRLFSGMASLSSDGTWLTYDTL